MCPNLEGILSGPRKHAQVPLIGFKAAFNDKNSATSWCFRWSVVAHKRSSSFTENKLGNKSLRHCQCVGVWYGGILQPHLLRPWRNSEQNTASDIFAMIRETPKKWDIWPKRVDTSTHPPLRFGTRKPLNFIIWDFYSEFAEKFRKTLFIQVWDHPTPPTLFRVICPK